MRMVSRRALGPLKKTRSSRTTSISRAVEAGEHCLSLQVFKTRLPLCLNALASVLPNSKMKLMYLTGLNRCGKSCRLRWTNYLRPDIKRGKFSPEEEQTILQLHSILGNKYAIKYLPKISSCHLSAGLYVLYNLRKPGGQPSRNTSPDGPTTRSRTYGTHT
jgi:hypothetical protein